MTKRRVLPLLLLVTASASWTVAETLVLRSGRTVEIQSYTLDGDTCVVTMPNGRVRRIPRHHIAQLPPATEPAPAGPSETKAEPSTQASKEGVFTNEDLAKYDDGQPDEPAPTTSPDREARKYDKQKSAEERKWDAWRQRYIKAQTQLDAAQANLDRLEAQADEISGDVDTAGDGTKISGMRGGRGYYWQLEKAKREVSDAETRIARLRDEAAAAGVPPGVMR